VAGRLAPGSHGPLWAGTRHEAEVDVLVVGSGVAGLAVALSLAGSLRMAVVSKEPEGGGSTLLAQGGIAAALGPGDAWELHAADTLAAAAGLGDPGAAAVVASEAPEAVAALRQWGVNFDEGALAREGGHSRARVAHARGDATGAEISRALVGAARQAGVAMMGSSFLLDLATSPADGSVTGAVVWDGAAPVLVTAKTVVLATGGYGQLWAATTSPPACSGDGLAAAFRAGAQLADLEFVQFHPTGLALGTDPRPLATEALRGAGARLRDATGEYLHGDPAGDLAPRDVVSRSMAQRMAALGAAHCFLDATGIKETSLVERFPTFVATCRSAGLDPSRQWVPVAPTAHYTMGGALSDIDGRTTLEGLMAVGEVASSGLHGANRLASNSLLEGVVIGRRAAAVLLAEAGRAHPRRCVALDEVLDGPDGAAGAEGDARSYAEAGSRAQPRRAGPAADRYGRAGLRAAVQQGAGVVRDASQLQHLAGQLAAWPLARPGPEGWEMGGPEGWELGNMVLVGRLVAALALRRCESRGAHWRADYPAPHPDWRTRQVVGLGPTGRVAVGNLEVAAASPSRHPEISVLR